MAAATTTLLASAALAPSIAPCDLCHCSEQAALMGKVAAGS